MRKILSGLVLGLSWVGQAQAADAPAPAESVEGVEIGAKLGYQLPGGEFAKDAKMSDDLAAAPVLGLEGGYRINRMLYAGATVLWAPSIEYKACPDCSGSVLRPGVGVRIHPADGLPVDPWFSLSIGFDRISLQKKYYDAITKTNIDRTATASGLEWLNLSVGADYAVVPGLALNAFLAYSFGRYTSVSDGEIKDPAVHNWIMLGVGGRYHL